MGPQPARTRNGLSSIPPRATQDRRSLHLPALPMRSFASLILGLIIALTLSSVLLMPTASGAGQFDRPQPPTPTPLPPATSTPRPSATATAVPTNTPRPTSTDRK